MHLIDKNVDTTTIQQAYTTLHKKIQYQIRLQTAKRIQKIAQGAIPWSPDYKQHCKKNELWERALKHSQGVSTSKTILRRLASNQGIQNIFTKDSVEILACQDKAYKTYKQFKQKATSTQVTHLEDLAQSLADSNQTSKEKEL
jgi:hypothetical protein